MIFSKACVGPGVQIVKHHLEKHTFCIRFLIFCDVFTTCLRFEFVRPGDETLNPSQPYNPEDTKPVDPCTKDSSSSAIHCSQKLTASPKNAFSGVEG